MKIGTVIHAAIVLPEPYSRGLALGAEYSRVTGVRAMDFQ
jgi:hypothetical protein